MSAAALDRRGEFAGVPDAVDSPTGKLVYLYLATAGRATADELAERLDVQKITLFSVLGALAKRGVVERDGDRYALA